MRDAVTLIAILLIGLILLGPSLMSGLSDLGKTLGDWVEHGWDWENGKGDTGTTDQNGDDFQNGDNITDTESEGQLCMGVTIKFTDGTQHTVGPEDMVFTLFPMTVFFEGKEVNEIWVHCYLLVDWTGDITSFKVSGPMQISSDSIVLRKEGMLKNYGAGDLPKNEWFEVWKFGLDAFDIEYVLGSGDYTLVTEATVKGEAMFSDAHTEIREATATANLPIFIEEGTMTVFSVEIQPQVLNP